MTLQPHSCTFGIAVLGANMTNSCGWKRVQHSAAWRGHLFIWWMKKDMILTPSSDCERKLPFCFAGCLEHSEQIAECTKTLPNTLTRAKCLKRPNWEGTLRDRCKAYNCTANAWLLNKYKQCIWDYCACAIQRISRLHAMTAFYLTTNISHFPQLLPPCVSVVGW